MIALGDIAPCFEGEVPALICTSSPEGTPNLAHLTRVHMVDATHVATSNQFFTKTSRNLQVNPVASLLVIHPRTLVSYSLLLRHDRSDEAGAVFDEVRRSIEVIATLTGMEDVFALRSVDIFEVLEATLVPSRGTVEG